MEGPDDRRRSGGPMQGQWDIGPYSDVVMFLASKTQQTQQKKDCVPEQAAAIN